MLTCLEARMPVSEESYTKLIKKNNFKRHVCNNPKLCTFDASTLLVLGPSYGAC